jgi:hypothetical protein
MRRAGWNGAGRIVDKQVSNRWLLGLARVMFPKSTMIHTVRDPLDTCLSIFLVQFTQGMPLANDLAEIGRQYVRYRAVIDYWVREMPGAFIHINHEALVADPERGIRELVEMCELPWSDECLRFYENTRAVETASAQQVRRPISGERVGRWRNYEKHLGPLIEALGPYVSEARTDLRPTG